MKIGLVLLCAASYFSFTAHAGICTGKVKVNNDKSVIVLEAFTKAVEYVAFPSLAKTGAKIALKRLNATRNGNTGYEVNVCTQKSGTANELYYIEILSTSSDDACGIHIETTKSGALAPPKVYKVFGANCAG